MLVRPKKAPTVQKGEVVQSSALSHIFPAPVKGLVLVGSPVTPIEASARVLENYICTTNGIVPRGGSLKHATIDGAAVSLFTYATGGLEKMFAATATDIYDVTSPVDASVVETPQVSGLTEGYFSAHQFGTSGGQFLIAVNGVDYLQFFDAVDWNPIAGEALNDLGYDALTADFAVGETLTGGTSGATAEILGLNKSSATEGTLKLGAITGGPYQDNEALTSAGGAATANGVSAAGSAIAITGKATTAFSAAWSHANRMWFVEKNTSSAWYLPINSIGGAVTEFPLRSVFRRGGSLLFGTTWSMDAGDGLDDKCVFVSTEGEVAVYGGTDPASGSTWSLDGVYDMPRPMGKNAFVRAGGDVLIATQTGLIPISSAVKNDIYGQVGVSQPISPLWQKQAQNVVTDGWEIIKVPDQNMMIVSQPDTTDPDGLALCVNMQTGAWSTFTGWDTRCVAEFNSRGYFADGNGIVQLMNSGGSDNGEAYTCNYIGQFEHVGAPGAVKTILQAKAMFKSASPINPKVSVLTDYIEDLPTAPASPANYSTDEWDSAVWDVSKWDSGDTTYSIVGQWQSVGATGTTMAPALQMTFGVTPTPKVEFTSVTMQYTAGAAVA